MGLVSGNQSFPRYPIVVHTDNTTVLGTLRTYAIAKSCPQTSKAVAALAAYCRCTAAFSAHHVYAHDYHPWNELVDSVAKAVSAGEYTPVQLVDHEKKGALCSTFDQEH